MQTPGTETRGMKGLLALVIAMGVLIVAALVVVVVTIVNRMGGPEPRAASAATSFDAVDLPVPAGCQLVETVTADDRLILRLGSGERCNQLIFVDLATGKHLGTVRLVPK